MLVNKQRLKVLHPSWLQAIANKLRDLVGELPTACYVAFVSPCPAAASLACCMASAWHQQLVSINHDMVGEVGCSARRP